MHVAAATLDFVTVADSLVGDDFSPQPFCCQKKMQQMRDVYRVLFSNVTDAIATNKSCILNYIGLFSIPQ